MQVWDKNTQARATSCSLSTRMDTQEGRQAAAAAAAAVQVICAELMCRFCFHIIRPESWVYSFTLCRVVVRLVSASYCKRHQATGRGAVRQRLTSTQLCRWRSMRQCQRDACRSGNRERVVRFKIFKKGGFNVSGCHTGSRDTPQTLKRFPKCGSKRTCDGGDSPVLFSFSVSGSCSGLIPSRPLAQTLRVCVHAHTLNLAVKVPLHCSQIKRESKALKWIMVTWICQLRCVVLKHGSVTPQERTKKTKQEVQLTHNSCLHGWRTVKKHTSTKSNLTDCWLSGVTHDSAQHLETNIQYIAPKDKRWTEEKQVSAVIAYG